MVVTSDRQQTRPAPHPFAAPRGVLPFGIVAIDARRAADQLVDPRLERAAMDSSSTTSKELVLPLAGRDVEICASHRGNTAVDGDDLCVDVRMDRAEPAFPIQMFRDRQNVPFASGCNDPVDAGVHELRRGDAGFAWDRSTTPFVKTIARQSAPPCDSTWRSDTGAMRNIPVLQPSAEVVCAVTGSRALGMAGACLRDHGTRDLNVTYVSGADLPQREIDLVRWAGYTGIPGHAETTRARPRPLRALACSPALTVARARTRAPAEVTE
jgi:hypothetical protein